MRKATRICLALGTSAALLSLSALPASAAEVPSDATIEVQGGTISIGVGSPLESAQLTPGETAKFGVSAVAVTNNRADTLDWTAQVSLTDFAPVGMEHAKPITAAGATYVVTPESLDNTGLISVLAAKDVVWASASEDLPAVTATGVEGNNTAIWDATLTVDVPDAALAGTYEATLTHSVL